MSKGSLRATIACAVAGAFATLAAPANAYVYSLSHLEIDNLQIARMARLAGAPKVVGAGVDLFRKLGDSVSSGDVLYRVHASYASDLEFARQAGAKSSGYTVGQAGELPHAFVEF